MKINDLSKELGVTNKEVIDLLKANGLENDFNCITHDIYFTNCNLDNLTENEMKQRCIRLRSVNDSDYKVQNNLDVVTDKIIAMDNIDDFEKNMITKGYKKVFDTKKKDHHYYKDGMTSKVQLQEIDNIGLVVYFDNKEYYEEEEILFLPFSCFSIKGKEFDEKNHYYKIVVF